MLTIHGTGIIPRATAQTGRELLMLPAQFWHCLSLATLRIQVLHVRGVCRKVHRQRTQGNTQEAVLVAVDAGAVVPNDWSAKILQLDRRTRSSAWIYTSRISSQNSGGIRLPQLGNCLPLRRPGPIRTVVRIGASSRSNSSAFCCQRIAAEPTSRPRTACWSTNSRGCAAC